MRHPGYPDELFEVFGNELRPVVGNDSRSGSRVLFFRSLKNDFNLFLGHLLSDLPMDDGTTATIEKAAQVVEGTADIEVRNIYMPVVVRQ